LLWRQLSQKAGNTPLLDIDGRTTIKILVQNKIRKVYKFSMIHRLYIHNFRCLENFELPISGHSSVLLIGKNGSGKTTIGRVLAILQRIARGTNRVGDLLKPGDFTRGRTDGPIRFEIEVLLDGSVYKYAVAFEFPKGFRELRVFEETLSVDGDVIFGRNVAQVHLATGPETGANFRIDWHLVALPIIQWRAEDDPLDIFKRWLAGSLILRPEPNLIRGNSERETLQPNTDMTNLGAWFSGLLASTPAAYTEISEYLKQVMPDFQDLKNLASSTESRNLAIQFSNKLGRFTLPFGDLSEGEKVFVIYALVIAANASSGPLLCFWDEPDNHLTPSEVSPSMMALRRAFKSHGQLIATSHNPEAIRRFSDENTLYLYRNSHLEPTVARSLEDIRAAGSLKGDLIDALTRGDV
jgi:predicted ATPase